MAMPCCRKQNYRDDRCSSSAGSTGTAPGDRRRRGRTGRWTRWPAHLRPTAAGPRRPPPPLGRTCTIGTVAWSGSASVLLMVHAGGQGARLLLWSIKFGAVEPHHKCGRRPHSPTSPVSRPGRDTGMSHTCAQVHRQSCAAQQLPMRGSAGLLLQGEQQGRTWSTAPSRQLYTVAASVCQACTTAGGVAVP